MPKFALSTLAGLAALAGTAAMLSEPANSFAAPRTGLTIPAVRNAGTIEGLSVIAAIAIFGESQPVDEPYCDRTAALSESLRDDFLEQPAGPVATAQGMTLRLWMSEEMRTWTVTATRRVWISCVLSSGTGSTGQAEFARLVEG